MGKEVYCRQYFRRGRLEKYFFYLRSKSVVFLMNLSCLCGKFCHILGKLNNGKTSNFPILNKIKVKETSKEEMVHSTEL